MRFSIRFTAAFLVLLWYALPVLGGIALLITLCGLLLAKLEGLPIGEGLYLTWVTATTVGYGDLSPTSGASRLLAIIIALIGIPFDGLIAAVAIIAARLSIDEKGYLGTMIQNAEARFDEALHRGTSKQ